MKATQKLKCTNSECGYETPVVHGGAALKAQQCPVCGSEMKEA